MATTINVSQILPFVVPEVPGAPDALVSRMIMLTANDYCIATGVWDEIQDPTIVIDKVHTYDVDVPKGAQVATIKNIWLPNRELIAATMDQIQQFIPNWQSSTGAGPVYFNAAQDWSTYRIFPTPENANKVKMTLRVAYAPDQFGSVLPSFLMDRWLDEITAGAKARLQSMPGKAWSNQAAAQENRRIYEDGVLEAKIFMAHDKVLGNVRVKPVRII
jgi:hypothetical protein